MYGMETTFFNFNSKLENKQEVYNAALVSILSSSIIFGLILIIFSPYISEFLSTPNAVYSVSFITWCVGIIATDAMMSIPFAKLRADNKALNFSLLKFFNVLVNFGLTVFFISICKNAYDKGEESFFANLYDPQIGIGYCFLANLIANGLTLLLISKQFLMIRFRINTELLKEMLKYTWPLVILGFAGMINETLDRLVLKKLMPDKAEAQVAQGIYGACYKIAILMTIFIQAFRFFSRAFLFRKSKRKGLEKNLCFCDEILCYFLPATFPFNFNEPGLDQIYSG